MTSPGATGVPGASWMAATVPASLATTGIRPRLWTTALPSAYSVAVPKIRNAANASSRAANPHVRTHRPNVRWTGLSERCSRWSDDSDGRSASPCNDRIPGGRRRTFAAIRVRSLVAGGWASAEASRTRRRSQIADRHASARAGSGQVSPVEETVSPGAPAAPGGRVAQTHAALSQFLRRRKGCAQQYLAQSS